MAAGPTSFPNSGAAETTGLGLGLSLVNSRYLADILEVGYVIERRSTRENMPVAYRALRR